MKRFLRAALAVFMACQMCLTPALAAPEWPSDTGILAEGGIVIDADSGAMLFGQNVRLQYFPASITKLLTALVVIENASLDDTVTFSEDAVYNVEAGSGNKLGFETGDQMTVEDCLYAMLLVSSNQSSNALAEHVAGSRAAFVDMMNAKAAELGCTGSHFKNPSGLNDPEQVVTAYDMALIARAAFANPKLFEIASSKSHSFPPTINSPEGSGATMECRILTTTDENSEFYFPDALAAKTGYTSLAGNTLVTYASRNGRNVISVVLKGSQPQYYLDTISLLDFGLRQFKNVNIAENEPGLTSGDVPVTVGDVAYAPSDLTMDASAVITLPDDAVFTDAVRSLVTELPAGAPAGAVALVQYRYNDRKVGEVYLIDKNAAAAAAALAETADETDPAAADSTKASEENEKASAADAPLATDSAATPSDAGGGFPVGPAAALAVIAALGAGIAFYVIRSRAEEARQAELRRERRRKRLEEDGCEEEFERMLKERLEKENLEMPGAGGGGKTRGKQ